jgi:hypothetical protein
MEPEEQLPLGQSLPELQQHWPSKVRKDPPEKNQNKKLRPETELKEPQPFAPLLPISPYPYFCQIRGPPKHTK